MKELVLAGGFGTRISEKNDHEATTNGRNRR